MIADNVFVNCTSLSEIFLSESVRCIGLGAFQNTAYYNDPANWEDGALYIGNHLIEADPASSSYTVKEGTLSIAGGAFRNRQMLASVRIPDSVAYIGAYAFENCTALTSVTIPDSVTTIDSYAFSGCSALKNVTLSDRLTGIGTYAFSGCESLS